MSIAQNNIDHEYSTFETCYYGMNSIFDNSPNKDLLNKSVLEGLKKESNSFEVDKIHLIKELNQFECDVFTTDVKGVRRFAVKLEKNSKFEHKFKILDIKERKVDSRYQI